MGRGRSECHRFVHLHTVILVPVSFGVVVGPGSLEIF
jgi:hypothetical protein